MRSPLLILLAFVFFIDSLCPHYIGAQELVLPTPGSMVQLSPALDPAVLKGIKVHPENPFKFDFVLDKGQSMLRDAQIKEESTKLVKYFLSALTIPEKDLWVNLSPYEKDRIVPESFGQTEMGRDLLAQDYLLKQITASLVYPEGDIGKQFWKRVYELSGNKNVPVNTFNKVWIVPDKAVVYENAKNGTAYVVESSLKVLTEQDYLAQDKNAAGGAQAVRFARSLRGTMALSPATPRGDGLSEDERNSWATGPAHAIRDLVIPQLTKEVNTGANFAQLRQVYNSLILATWYKKRIKDSILSQVYSDKNKVDGIKINDPKEKERIYTQYLEAFKKGAYNYIKEEQDPNTHQISPRKYFSGGFDLAMLSQIKTTDDPQSIAPGRNEYLSLEVGINESIDPAQITVKKEAQRFYYWLFPRKTLPDWTVEKITSLKQDTADKEEKAQDAVEVFQDLLRSFQGDPEKLFMKIRADFDLPKINTVDLTKRIKAGYYDSGAHKDVYLIEFETRRGPPLTMAIVLKREQAPGDIAGNEVTDLRRLTKLGKKEKSKYPVPAMGDVIKTEGGRLMYLEEFIEGSTVDQLEQQGKLTLKIRQKLIENLFKISRGLSAEISIPIDFHKRNWVVNSDGEPIMVDIGNRRVNIFSQRESAGHRSEAFLLMSLMVQYGFGDARDRFIFDAIARSLPAEATSAFFENVLAFFINTEGVARLMQKKGGTFFLDLRGGDGDFEKALQGLAENFNEIFKAYLDNPAPYINENDLKGVNPKVIAGVLLLVLVSLRSSDSNITIDPETIAQLEKISGAIPQQMQSGSPAVEQEQKVEREKSVQFHYSEILSLGSKGAAFNEFKELFLKAQNIADLERYIKDLKGKVNPITGRVYIFQDDPGDVVHKALNAATLTREVEIALIAFQRHWNLREDGDVGPETRTKIKDQMDRAMVQPVATREEAESILVTSDQLKEIQQQRALTREEIQQFSEQFPSFDWEKASYVPWGEVVHDPRREPGPQNLNQLHMWQNLFDVRRYSLFMVKDILEGKLDAQGFKTALIAMHRRLLLGEKGSRPYFPRLMRTLIKLQDESSYGVLNNHMSAKSNALFPIIDRFLKSKDVDINKKLDYLAEFYVVFMHPEYFFQEGNNSLVMDMINGLLRLSRSNGIAHGNMDRLFLMDIDEITMRNALKREIVGLFAAAQKSEQINDSGNQAMAVIPDMSDKEVEFAKIVSGLDLPPRARILTIGATYGKKLRSGRLRQHLRQVRAEEIYAALGHHVDVFQSDEDGALWQKATEDAQRPAYMQNIQVYPVRFGKESPIAEGSIDLVDMMSVITNPNDLEANPGNIYGILDGIAKVLKDGGLLRVGWYNDGDQENEAARTDFLLRHLRKYVELVEVTSGENEAHRWVIYKANKINSKEFSQNMDEGDPSFEDDSAMKALSVKEQTQMMKVLQMAKESRLRPLGVKGETSALNVLIKGAGGAQKALSWIDGFKSIDDLSWEDRVNLRKMRIEILFMLGRIKQAKQEIFQFRDFVGNASAVSLGIGNEEFEEIRLKGFLKGIHLVHKYIFTSKTSGLDIDFAGPVLGYQAISLQGHLLMAQIYHDLGRYAQAYQELGKCVSVTDFHRAYFEKLHAEILADIHKKMDEYPERRGGIDLNDDRLDLRIKNDGGSMSLYVDPAMLEQLKSVPGFTPVIINIQPLPDVKAFLINR